jgi:hypothetical protein
MKQRDIEDITMQARENVRTVMDEVMGEMTEDATKRAVGAFWAQLPKEVKDQLAKDKPDVAQKMNEMYGQPQGNPWGEQKGR